MIKYFSILRVWSCIHGSGRS